MRRFWPKGAVLIRRALCAAAMTLALPAAADTPSVADWNAVSEAARGEVVDFHAWGGESHINDYIGWVGEEVERRYGVKLAHTKLTDTAEAVAQVLAETVAGRTEGGAVDLIWINGENFAAMKEAGLLLGGRWAEALPHHTLVDATRLGRAVTHDFGIPIDGMESPWGRAQLLFMYDERVLPAPPADLDALIAFVEANPGRFTYPRPPAFMGTTFLKQVLLMTVPDRSVLDAPAGPDAEAFVRAHLLPPLERLHPHLWRSGRAFPQGVAEMRRLFADGELTLSLTQNPSDAEAAIRAGLLPPTVRVGGFAEGMVGNVHFVAIPHNANDRAGALVVANFLLSPEAQARKADPAVWGDPTVLDVDSLPEADRDRFAAEVAVPLPTLTEPHASWTPIIERVWAEMAFL